MKKEKERLDQQIQTDRKELAELHQASDSSVPLPAFQTKVETLMALDTLIEHLCNIVWSYYDARRGRFDDEKNQRIIQDVEQELLGKYDIWMRQIDAGLQETDRDIITRGYHIRGTEDMTEYRIWRFRNLNRDLGFLSGSLRKIRNQMPDWPGLSIAEKAKARWNRHLKGKEYYKPTIPRED